MPTDASVEGGLDEPTELEPDQGSLALADPADDHTRADWEAAAAAVLRKAGRLAEDDGDDLVWERLTRTTLDGLAVPPLGTPDLLEELTTSGRPTRAAGWHVRTRVADNETALADLDTGATALTVPATADLEALLEGVLLDLAPVVVDAGDATSARAFLAVLADTTPADGTNLGVAATGADLVEVARLARDAGVLAAVVDGTAVHDAGASDVQELGRVLADAAAYLRTLSGAGFSVDEAAGLVEFRLSATDHQFPTIAKLRAVRRLWARMQELSGVDAPVPMRLHVVTSRAMLSRYDPWVNMLRTTVAAFAAGVAGADAVTVVPFDSPLGEPDAFGRRIARNTSHLLMSESHLGRVADPAGGSYAVEKLTDDLAVAAWAELGRIEADGLDAFDARVAETVAARDRAVATRKQPLTGLTEFPNLAETLPERSGEGDDVRRWGAAFEALRAEPATSPVLLATLGPVSAHTARATFATNLLAAGGIAVTSEPDGARVAVVAGTDAAYDEEGAARAASLREAGVGWVVVAGRPRDWADDSCALGVDALDFLTRTKERLS
ncbi:methylmalonyl-CoA mutase family protein [Nocardioides aestuarii]|uniref:Methylmalonyl-CoA mutase family protein n=1 Tax=Nocardioides aestuarii TaxID=252231 RepID=A0ABW4TQN3_9ACTN